MEMVWVVLLTALLSFCFWFTYKLGYRRGYIVGGKRVATVLRNQLNELGEMENDK